MPLTLPRHRGLVMLHRPPIAHPTSVALRRLGRIGRPHRVPLLGRLGVSLRSLLARRLGGHPIAKQLALHTAVRATGEGSAGAGRVGCGGLSDAHHHHHNHRYNHHHTLNTPKQQLPLEVGSHTLLRYSLGGSAGPLGCRGSRRRCGPLARRGSRRRCGPHACRGGKCGCRPLHNAASATATATAAATFVGVLDGCVS